MKSKSEIKRILILDPYKATEIIWDLKQKIKAAEEALELALSRSGHESACSVIPCDCWYGAAREVSNKLKRDPVTYRRPILGPKSLL